MNTFNVARAFSSANQILCMEVLSHNPRVFTQSGEVLGSVRPGSLRCLSLVDVVPARSANRLLGDAADTLLHFLEHKAEVADRKHSSSYNSSA